MRLEIVWAPITENGMPIADQLETQLPASLSRALDDARAISGESRDEFITRAVRRLCEVTLDPQPSDLVDRTCGLEWSGLSDEALRAIAVRGVQENPWDG
jgi:hypothetical protein